MIHNFYPIQNEIERIQKENNELLLHIKEMETVFQKQKKEIENIKNKNIYQKEIKSHINDVNNLTSLKYEYCNKLNHNIKCIEKAQNEVKLLEEILSKINNDNSILTNKEKSNIKFINNWLNILKQDLQGTIDEINQRIEQNQTQIVNLAEQKLKQQKSQQSIISNKSNINNIFDVRNSIDSNNIIRNKSNLNSFIKNSKFYIKPAVSLRKNINSVVNVLQTKNNNQNEQFLGTNSELVNTKNYYSEINKRVESNLLNLNRVFKKKVHHLSICVNSNETRLNSLVKDNVGLRNEINSLDKIYKLTKERNDLNKKLKTTFENKVKQEKRNMNSENINFINKMEQSINQNDLLNKGNHFEIEEQIIKPRNINNNINKVSINIQKPFVLYRNSNLYGNNYYTPKNIQIRTKKLNEIKEKYLGNQQYNLDSSI